MLILQKTIQTTWERARGSLREDLVQIELIMNKLWGKTFGVDLKLKNSVIDGDGGIVQTGDDGNVTTGPVDLSDGSGNVTGRLPFANLVQIAASKLLGRRSTSAGDIEEITLGTGLTMTGQTLDVTSSPTSDIFYVPMTTGWEPPTDMDEHIEIMSDGAGNVLLVAWEPDEP